MAKIPIDEAPAGPAMDAAVAEALGWLPYESDGVWYWKDMSDDDFPYWNHHANGYGFVEDLKPWSPSTDIAAAWELADKISFRQDSTLGCFSVHCYGWIGECWEAGWVDQPVGDVVARAHTAPLAICRAFLKANGVEYLEIGE